MSTPAAVAAHVDSHSHSHGPANRGRRVLSTAAPLYVVAPRGPVRGGVVLLHDRAGLTAEVERCARRLARDSWLVVAPFHYYDTGGRVYADPEQAPRPHAESLHADVRAALSHLVERCGLPRTHLTAVGIGTGGHLAAWAAGTGELAAAAGVDRPGPGPSEAPARCPWQDVSGPDPDWAQLGRFLARPHVSPTTTGSDDPKERA